MSMKGNLGMFMALAMMTGGNTGVTSTPFNPNQVDVTKHNMNKSKKKSFWIQGIEIMATSRGKAIKQYHKIMKG